MRPATSDLADVRSPGENPPEQISGAGECEFPAVQGAAGLGAVCDGAGGATDTAIGISAAGYREQLDEGICAWRRLLLVAEHLVGRNPGSAVPEQARIVATSRSAHAAFGECFFFVFVLRRD